MTAREKIRFWFDDLSTPMGKAVDLCVIALILLSCVVLVAQTYADTELWQGRFLMMEGTIMGLFVIEYGLRLWSSRNRLRHIFKLYSLIDLAAILPVFLVGSVHLQVMRVFRVVRLLRFLSDRDFPWGRIHASHLTILRIIYILLCIIYVASGFFWHFEKEANEEINDFGDAIYYSVVTLSTVGFGDIVPMTREGRIVTVLMIIAGIIFIPWELRNLVYHATRTQQRSEHCSVCGFHPHDLDAVCCKRCGSRLRSAPELTPVPD
jgi:voltage-gated potassium channel